MVPCIKFIFSLCLIQQLTCSTIICPLDFETVNELLNYRYQLLCSNLKSNVCPFTDVAKSDTYAPFIILFHDGQWDKVEMIGDQISRCGMSYVVVDIDQNADFNLTAKCSTAISTIVISITETIIDVDTSIDNKDCIPKKYVQNAQLLDMISSTCPNTVWITGTTDCNSTLTSTAWKVLRNASDLDILGDRTYGKFYIKNKHLRVSIRPVKNGVPVYDGVLMQIFEKIAENLDFTYTLVPSPDNKYGAPTNNTLGWNGMVRQLIANETDIAVADFTITPIRSLVIDFGSTYYYEVYGIMIKQVQAETNIWGMFSLFAPAVWAGIFVCCIVTSIGLYVLHRFSALPLNTVFNKIGGCGWYAVCCLSNQGALALVCLLFAFNTLRLFLCSKPGSEYDPVMWSAQNLMALWWVFVVAVLATYSGGLMAMLSSSFVPLPFKDLTGLAALVRSGNFRICTMASTGFWGVIMADDQTNENYMAIADFLRKNPKFNSEDETFCLQQVINNNDVAYLEELTSLETFQREYCDNKFVILNDKFYPGYFGFGFQKQSLYNHIISQELINAVEGGLVTGLKKKYSTDLPFCDIIPPDQPPVAQTSSLKILNFTAPFVLLLVGIGISLMRLAYERIYFKKKPESIAINVETQATRRKRKPVNSSFVSVGVGPSNSSTVLFADDEFRKKIYL